MERGERKVVVDASVAVKWFVEEEYTREALLLRESYLEGLVELIAPCLLPYEVLNALKYSAAFGEDELKEIASALESLQIRLYSLEGNYAATTIEVAMRSGLTIYDASYIGLALVEKATLYTADEKLLKKAGSLGIAKHIRDYKVP
ncbi:type II toxin-antitoxin system VapC family toxin [Aeropyrum camini]|uniref:Predicted nucleic acid-binding protein n=1 Tax=Aeropyrum camini SY1 = JCM 12091 TaxID=1198449 RepID=U3TCT6_9CREN|nr:type II toxin-antitoxin system VapC family toxin [Aeropyrum camini]BAN90236.1 predicted nucleic acid-binding protein [Aeropyrum camini SY1 = JCM 12091]